MNWDRIALVVGLSYAGLLAVFVIASFLLKGV